jgi:disease resistance protein RPM1
VVTIIGVGGMGKTTLANQVYQELKAQFECCAFITVSRTPDMMSILRIILSEVSNQCYVDTEAGNIQQLIGKVHDFLIGKR